MQEDRKQDSRHRRRAWHGGMGAWQEWQDTRSRPLSTTFLSVIIMMLAIVRTITSSCTQKQS